MKIKNIQIQLLAAATELLRNAVPEITAENLLAALKNYNPSKANPDDKPKRPYKIKEVMEILQLSKPSIYVLIRSGQLTRIKLGASARITADSVSRLIEGNK